MKRLLPVILLVLCSMAVAVSVARTPQDEARKRADYYYLEAQRQNALGNVDAYYKLIGRAHELNPEDAAVGADLGYFNFQLADKDSLWRGEALALMRRNVDEYPADKYSGIAYFTMSRQVGQIQEARRVIARLDSIYPDKAEIAFRYADLLSHTGDSVDGETAIGLYNRMEKELGKSISLTMPKIRAYMGRRDTVRALAELNSLVASDPRNVEILTVAGDFNMTLVRNDSALVYYNRACEADTTSGLAFYKRAAFYQVTGDTARYEQEILSTIDKENLDPEVRLELLRTLVVDMLADSTRNEEIELIFDNVVEKHPRETELRKLYSAYLVSQKQYAKAAEQQSYSLDIDHSREEDWLQLCYLYGMADDFDTQKRTLEDALRYFPNSLDVKILQANNLLMTKKYPEALAKAKVALEEIYSRDDVQPDMVSRFEALTGDIYHQLGNLDSTYLHYDKALEANPDNTLVMNNYAYFLACNGGDLDKAEAMSMRAVAEQPESATVADTYAWVLFKKNNIEKAFEEINRTLELMKASGENPSEDVLHHAGDIYFFNKKHSEALDFWKRALELAPENSLLQKKVRNKTYYYEDQ